MNRGAFETLFNETRNFIEFTDVQHEDSGVYRCVATAPVDKVVNCRRKAIESKLPSNPDPLEEPTSEPLIHTIVLSGPPLAVQVNVVLSSLSSVAVSGVTLTPGATA